MNPAVSVKNLSVNFHEHTVLDNISFKLPDRSFTVIVGPNGSGKSTLIRSLLGIIEPEKGEIRIYDRTPSGINPEWMGYVPQTKTLDRNFPGIALELVVSGLRRSWPFFIKQNEKEKAQSALSRVGALHLSNRPLTRLSGGELQRIYLARSIIHNPRIILLDEPMTGIDAAGEADSYRLFDELNKDMTLIMVTHDLETAFHHASHVMVLNKKLIGYGKPEECLTGECLRIAFGHVGHSHPRLKGAADG
ncbi:MAG: metal ABC transporter ATP-binding protein [Spirochaetia bacterium]|nr:metal ABC transporter ATP-binding protein [Spirochaetia bacterium]